MGRNLTPWWIALACWYAGLAYVAFWNHRSRPIWRRLDAYPLRLRVRVFTPFARRWRDGIRAGDRAWVARFRRAVLWRAAFSVLPPLVIFGYLYGTTWARYSHTLERRAHLEAQAALYEQLSRARGFPDAPLRPIPLLPSEAER